MKSRSNVGQMILVYGRGDILDESILESIKTMLGGAAESGSFDLELCIFINSAFSTLCQNGVGPAKGFVVHDDTETWNDFLGEGVVDLEFVKTYVYYRTRLAFDPPSSSFVLESFKELANEAFWRAGVQASYDASEYGNGE